MRECFVLAHLSLYAFRSMQAGEASLQMLLAAKVCTRTPPLAKQHCERHKPRCMTAAIGSLSTRDRELICLATALTVGKASRLTMMRQVRCFRG